MKTNIINKKIFFLLAGLFSIVSSSAQQFITKAEIEFEVKSNFKKTMGNGLFDEIDNLPQYKTAYYNFTFADNKSIYKFDHWNVESKRIPDWWKKNDEENVWYYNYNSGIYNNQKNVDGTNINLEDSIPKLKWRITNDNRVIAGFNCRKAVAIIFDSVYVFAFYTDEIMISGGPCSINGLPGMILGVTIPRLFTSYIATKVIVNNVDENVIKPVVAKKNYNMKFLEATINDRFKDWIPDNDEQRQQRARFMWGILL
jgi:GLPGLI family protein